MKNFWKQLLVLGGGPFTCECNLAGSMYAQTYNTPQAAADGQSYTTVCELSTPCDQLELTNPCGAHSYCSEATGNATCICDDGYSDENDSGNCTYIRKTS